MNMYLVEKNPEIKEEDLANIVRNANNFAFIFAVANVYVLEKKCVGP